MIVSGYYAHHNRLCVGNYRPERSGGRDATARDAVTKSRPARASGGIAPKGTVAKSSFFNKSVLYLSVTQVGSSSLDNAIQSCSDTLRSEFNDSLRRFTEIIETVNKKAFRADVQQWLERKVDIGEATWQLLLTL